MPTLIVKIGMTSSPRTDSPTANCSLNGGRLKPVLGLVVVVGFVFLDVGTFVVLYVERCSGTGNIGGSYT